MENGKHKKICRSFSNITKTFALNSKNEPNNSICKLKEEPHCGNDMGNRGRTQGIFKSLKKKLKQNKLYTSKQKQSEDEPPIPPPRNIITKPEECESSPSRSSNDSNNSIGKEHFNLAKYGWFWGPITKAEAENQLCGKPDGTFLIRDSSSDRHVFTLTFRCYGQTMHSHIEYSRGVYSMGKHLSRSSVAELISAAIDLSKDHIFSYSKSRNPANPGYPVRLTKPLSRHTEVRSLMYLCRFVIRQCINVNNIQTLPLPSLVKTYLQKGQY